MNAFNYAISVIALLMTFIAGYSTGKINLWHNLHNEGVLTTEAGDKVC